MNNIVEQTSKSKASKKDRFNKRADAIEAHFGKEDTIELEGKPYQPKLLATLYRNAAAKIDAADAARRDWDTARNEREAAEEAVHEIDPPLKDKVTSKFGRSNPIVGDFAYKPAKVPERTAESKARAARKGMKTRQILGTKGKRQKKAALEAAREAGSNGAPHPPVPS